MKKEESFFFFCPLVMHFPEAFPPYYRELFVPVNLGEGKTSSFFPLGILKDDCDEHLLSVTLLSNFLGTTLDPHREVEMKGDREITVREANTHR